MIINFHINFLSDINECTTDNGGCNQTCVNEVGSYHCDCDDGFELDEDLHGCSGMYDLYVYICNIYSMLIGPIYKI